MMGLLEKTDEDIETRGVWKEEVIKVREEEERKCEGESEKRDGRQWRMDQGG